MGCTQLNTCTVLYNIVTSAELVTCLLSPSLSLLHLLGILPKSAHLFCHYTQLKHSVTSLLFVNLLVVLQVHDGRKYEHNFLHEQTHKKKKNNHNDSTISNMDNTTPIHYSLQSFNHLNSELNPMCCLLALLGAHHFLHISRIRVKLNPICYLLALLGAHHFLHVSRIRVKSLTCKRLMSYIYIWSTHS